MSIFLILLKTMAIGALGSIPVGPIVMLTVQRCLVSGQKAGMGCALGAILSDTIFAAMALFAVSITSDFMNKYSVPIQVCGGLIIVIVGIGMLIRRQCSRKISDKADLSISDAGKSILMGFSNPGSFFWIVAALSTTGISSGKITFLESVCAIAGILAGSTLYWLLLTRYSSRKGEGIMILALEKINRMFAGVIILFGLFFIINGVLDICF